MSSHLSNIDLGGHLSYHPNLTHWTKVFSRFKNKFPHTQKRAFFFFLCMNSTRNFSYINKHIHLKINFLSLAFWLLTSPFLTSNCIASWWFLETHNEYAPFHKSYCDYVELPWVVNEPFPLRSKLDFWYMSLILQWFYVIFLIIVFSYFFNMIQLLLILLFIVLTELL